MDQHEARRIAETGNLLRPDWPIRSLMTILAEFRHLDPLDVHLAVVWIAYDPGIDSPGILRHPGMWWKLARQARAGTPELPTWKPRDPGPGLSPAEVARLAAEARHRLHQSQPDQLPTPASERPANDRTA